MLLQRLGHEVKVAYDGPSALDAATEFRPHLALIDIGLPGLCGYEVARRLIEVAPRSQARLLEQEPAMGAVRLALAEARGGARIPKYKT